MKIRHFLLIPLFFLVSASSFAGATLRVHTASPCTADNVWTGWHNLARPWLWIEYNKPWRYAKVWVHSQDHSYSRSFNISRGGDPCFLWIEDLASGKYDWSVNFEVDLGGGNYQWTGDIAGPLFAIDRTPPATPSFTEDHAGATPVSTSQWSHHTSPHFLFSSSDGESGLNRYEMSVNNGSYFTVSSGYHPTLNDGRYVFALRAVDNVGLTRQASHRLYLNVDIHAPNPPKVVVLAGLLADTAWPAWKRAASFPVYIYPGSDGTGSGAAVNQVSINGGTPINLRIDNGRSRWRPTFTSGQYVLDFFTVDRAGYVSSAIRKYLRVDVDKPSLEILCPANDTLIGSDTLEISWSGSDLHSGIDHFEISWDSITWTNVNTDTMLRVYNLRDTLYTFLLKAVDAAGNDSLCQLTFAVDASPPELSILAPAEGALFGSDSLTLSWTGRDTTSGIREYAWSSDSLTWIPCGSDTVVTVKDLPDGHHTLYVQATDRAGNMKVCSISFTTDTTPPQFTGGAYDRQLVAGTACSALLPDYSDSISVTDNLDDTLTLFQSPAAGTEVAGDTTTLILHAIDDAGNTAVIRFHITVADTTPPLCVCIADTTIMVRHEGDSSYQVEGTELDPLQVADNCSYSITNDLNGQSSLAEESFSIGTHVVLWTVTDAAGNSMSCSTTLTVNTYTAITIQPDSHLMLYPNPAGDLLHIKTSWVQYSVQITDLSGKIVLEKQDLQGNNTLPVGDLAHGLYVVKIFTKHKTVIRKIIKE